MCMWLCVWNGILMFITNNNLFIYYDKNNSRWLIQREEMTQLTLIRYISYTNFYISYNVADE